MRFDREIIVSQSNQKVIDALAAAVPALSRQKLKQAMDKGAVWLKKSKGQQRIRRATKLLSSPQALHIYYDENLLEKTAPTPTLIADLGAYSVWDKPAGMLAQGTPYGDHCALLRYAEKYFSPERESFLVHRLDSDASGLMLIAHKPKAAALLSDLFKQRNIIKRYRVKVEGLIDHPRTIDSKINGKSALTIIEKILETEDNATTLLVRIDSGRKHQIRRHLSAVEHPVVGDRRYGSTQLDEPLQLRAVEIAFECPITNQSQHFTVE